MTARERQHRAPHCRSRELVIPYGDPSPGSYRKNAFDTGEIGRRLLHQLAGAGLRLPRRDPLPRRQRRRPRRRAVRTIPNGICLHEEDDGILWKHTDPDGHVEVRRNRRLRGLVDRHRRQLRVRLLLVLRPGRLDRVRGQADRHRADDRRRPRASAAARAPRSLPACSRRSTSTSSARGSTSTSTASQHRASRSTRSRRRAGPDNPYGGAYTSPGDAARLASRRRKRLVDPMRSRYWKVVNPRPANRVGEPVGYKLVPGAPPRSRSPSPTRASASAPASCTTTCG